MSDDWKPQWIDDPIAEERFDCLSEDGDIVEVAVLVHRPRQLRSEEPFACGVEQRGLTFASKLTPGQIDKSDIYGDSSWQALSLAIQYANAKLVYACEQGIVFQWNGEALDMKQLFPWKIGGAEETK